LAGEGVSTVDELRGIPQCHLDELPALPDQQLALLAPGIREGVEIIPGDGVVLARRYPGTEPVLLFRTDPAVLLLFNRFDGSTPLGAAAQSLAAAMEWPEAKCFAAAKALFLHLVKMQACVPRNAPEL
jgi:hypothetical protein